MKLKLLAFALAATLAGTAQATLIDPDNGGGDPQINVGSLDWAPGSALVTPVTGSVTTPAVGDVFQTYALARLNAFQDTDGNGIGGLNLNGTTASTNYEWTYIAAFQEEVISVSGGGGVGNATFNTIAGGDNFFRIYYDPTPDAIPGNGTGFGPDSTDTDSILILEGTILPFNRSTLLGQTTFTASGVNTTKPNLDQFGTDNYPAIDSITGEGGGKLAVLPTFVNPLFFPNGAGLFLLTFDTQLNLPFTQTNPASCVHNGAALISAAGPNTLAGTECPVNTVGTINGISGPNEILMTDSSTSFSAIPEPGTLALLGLGLSVIALRPRRRS